MKAWRCMGLKEFRNLMVGQVIVNHTDWSIVHGKEISTNKGICFGPGDYSYYHKHRESYEEVVCNSPIFVEFELPDNVHRAYGKYLRLPKAEEYGMESYSKDTVKIIRFGWKDTWGDVTFCDNWEPLWSDVCEIRRREWISSFEEHWGNDFKYTSFEKALDKFGELYVIEEYWNNVYIYRWKNDEDGGRYLTSDMYEPE